MNSDAIRVDKVTKTFKLQYDKANTLKEALLFWNRKNPEIITILDAIDLTIKKGETVALIGTNGCGKSTLLKMMTKILYPNGGKITTNGKLTSLLELGAGFHPDFTGRENIYFNASVFGLTREEIDRRIDDIIDFSELGEFIEHPVRTYSSGMYMRLAFSVAINVDAEILLIDEILAVGDQHFQEKCFDRLMQLRDSDKTIVIVSHSLDTIEKLCNRAIWIYKGQVKEDGVPSVVIQNYLEQLKKDAVVRSVSSKKESVLTIESPYDGEYFIANHFHLQGWEVSNVEDVDIEVYLDDTLIEVLDRIERNDVLMHYQEAVGGIALNPLPGFKAKIEAPYGKHKLHVVVRHDKEVLQESTLSVELKAK